MVTNLRADERLRDWLSTAEYSQSDVAEILEVSRQAVSKWASGKLIPSLKHCAELDKLSQGAVPATIWARRKLPEPKSKGARAIQKAASVYYGSLNRLATETGLPQRSLARWGSSKNAPRQWQLPILNKALKANLTVDDFAVSV
jgi:transcriptional regulator with XRE-family HTH domain